MDEYIDLIPFLDACRHQGTTNMLLAVLRPLNDGYLLVADELDKQDALERGCRLEQVLTLDEASEQGELLKGALLLVDPHALREMQDRLHATELALAGAEASVAGYRSRLGLSPNQ